jgi:hypothetical protein
MNSDIVLYHFSESHAPLLQTSGLAGLTKVSKGHRITTKRHSKKNYRMSTLIIFKYELVFYETTISKKLYMTHDQFSEEQTSMYRKQRPK